MQHRLKNAHSDKRMAALMRVQAAYADWVSKILEAALYHDGATEALEPPRSFNLWMQAAQAENILSPLHIRSAHTCAHKVQEKAQELLISARYNKGLPDKNIFMQFSQALEHLRIQLQALIRISVLEDNGIDHLTGLFSPNAMHMALKVEMDRLARRGHSFVIALARIDHYESIVQALGAQAEKEATLVVATAIMDTLRIYDDAYRSGDGEFILCLKEADVHAGIAAMDRLHEKVACAGVTFSLPDEKGELSLTITSCLFVPLPGYTFDEILTDLRHDIQNAKQDPGTVLTHHEISPLERLLQERTQTET